MLSIKKAVEETARRNNVSISEIECEIQAMIDELYDSDDTEIRKTWHDICQNREKPSVEQLITFVADKVSAELNPYES